MDIRNVSAPARLVRLLAAAVSIATVATVMASPAAFAQQHKPAAKTPAKPAAQAQPAQPAAPAKEAAKLQLIYTPWVKVCGNDQQDPTKKTCAVMKDARLETNMMVVHAVIVEQQGQAEKLLRITLPYGVNLQVGTRVILDKEQPLTAPYVTCIPPVVAVAGCVADYHINDDMINKMKKGQTLLVQAIHVSQEPMNLPIPLADFAKAYDGPPMDPKVFEEQQKKFQEGLQKRGTELQKQAEEARKKLEQQPKK
ncbi:MAG TPA: invasion associated locus B family protein [Xanthobacteraceae bacterium]|jgi:invasion protein IalB|nr:invasion associated locus B family protein [Xanthobacteraceae bacterium]